MASSRDPEAWMWAEACELLERAERMHRQFFQPRRVRTERATWEPPVDLLETETELRITVALPGVPAERVEVHVDSGHLIVVGDRPLPAGSRRGAIRRLEIPYGRFERHIELPPGRYQIARQDLDNGCIELSLRKL